MMIHRHFPPITKLEDFSWIILSHDLRNPAKFENGNFKMKRSKKIIRFDNPPGNDCCKDETRPSSGVPDFSVLQKKLKNSDQSTLFQS